MVKPPESEGMVRIEALINIFFSSWKLRSQASNYSNLTPFWVNRVKGMAKRENPSTNLL